MDDYIEISREYLAEYIENKRIKDRIKIEKEKLEKLLFETYKCKIENMEITLKFPIWTGSFLRKIDLSEINFNDDKESNVYYIFDANAYALFTRDDISKFKSFREKYILGKKYSIDFSGTNAVFDFSKMFLAKKLIPNINLRDCNFDSINLKNSNLSDLFNRVSVSNCNFKNTYAEIDINLIMNNLVRNCNFINLKFENKHIDINEYECSNTSFFTNNFSGSGLYINADYTSEIGNAIKEGRLNGCVVNNKKIKSRKSEIEGINKKARKYALKIERQIKNN